jgi:uncharacterized protein YajQ (UPF0234 family)/MoaA/NifB/PqqE/SkfB family radical SAM enzyme
MEGLITAWGKILRGYRPSLSIEITRECPLRCPGCYAYGDEHLGGEVTLRQVTDYKGQDLVDRVLAIVSDENPIHVSLVGGEPLVRFRELNEILPALAARGIYTQVVTSAVRPIPAEWASIPRLQIVVSIDGLQPEHDARRTPATYDRILKHIAGHQITVHCTITRQQVQRDGYLEEFARTWSENPHVRQLWFSLYTPQLGETSAEILTPHDRERVVAALMLLRHKYRKIKMPEGLLAVRVHRVGGAGRGRVAPAAGRRPRRRHLRGLAEGRAGDARPARGGGLMAAAASFDITSTVDLQEVDNAVNQARKEVAQRYDFKGSRAAIDLNKTDNTIVLTADDDFKMNALWEILQTRMVRRGVPTKNLTPGETQRAANDTVKRTITLQQGIPTEAAKDIVKFLKDRKLKKVSAAIMTDQVRVSSPSKDELQEAMRQLREHDFGCALQFGNYRG